SRQDQPQKNGDREHGSPPVEAVWPDALASSSFPMGRQPVPTERSDQSVQPVYGFIATAGRDTFRMPSSRDHDLGGAEPPRAASGLGVDTRAGVVEPRRS